MPAKKSRRRSRRRLLFLALFLLVSLQAPSAAAGGGSPDAGAMSELAKALHGLPDSWNPGSNPCSPAWSGVTCTSSGRVTGINLVSAGVTGTLPADSLGKLSSLSSLQLQRNGLSGPLPSLAGLSGLQSLILDSNQFSSIPPDFFSGLTALQKVSLDDIPFSPWILSDFKDIASASSLVEFSASNASISGEIPDFFASLPNLQVLRLSYNSLSGHLPASFAAGSNIKNLILNNQHSDAKLTGRIDVIGSMTQLVALWLQSNAFTGPIPDLSNLSSLESFNLRDNQLTGIVPPSLLTPATLKNVSLANNNLQGPLPDFSGSVTADVDKGNQFCNPKPEPCDPLVTLLLAVAAGFGYPASLANSWKGNSPCSASGWFGVSCDSQGNIAVLNFANQHYGGYISPALANITSLTKIILSGNDLTGTIPDSLTQLAQLQLLDFSNNNISGQVPAFDQKVTLKTAGNDMLGIDVEPSGGGGSNPSGNGGGSGTYPSGSPSSNSKSSSAGAVVGTMVGLVVLIGLAVALFFYYRKYKQERKAGLAPVGIHPAVPEIVKIGVTETNASLGGGFNSLYTHSSADSASVYIAGTQGMHISTESIRRGTNDFSEKQIIGRGGFGVVYKGDLNGTIVAVKRNDFHSMGRKGQEEFRAEIDVLGKVRHRNLVTLLGYCDDGQESLLIYEYMPEGTLGDHLFDWKSRNQAALTWKQRLVISLDVARGIEYLHSLAQESFIHRDLKPSNILLDENLRAKVSDFGLVKLAADKQKSMMTRLAGTFGYLAPEYATTGKVSTKVDVYAFGVILMEIITGRKVLDDSLPVEETHLVSLFRRKVSHEKETLFDSVDQVLHLDAEDREGLLEIADLSWHCTAREHYQRPDMSHVVSRLAPLVEQWKPTNCDEDYDGDESSMSLTERLEKWQNGDTTNTTDFFNTHS